MAKVFQVGTKVKWKGIDALEGTLVRKDSDGLWIVRDHETGRLGEGCPETDLVLVCKADD